MRREEPATSVGEAGTVSGRRGIPWWSLLVLLLIWGWLTPAKLWRPGTVLGIDENVQIAEALAWWDGRLDLPERRWDTALYEGKVYSYFPPVFTIIAAAVVPFFGGIPHLVLALLACITVALAFLLFFRLTESAWWSLALGLGFVCGTSVFPVLDQCLRGGAPYSVNHVISVIGTLIFLDDYCGRRRVWPGCVGLVVTALSRQLTIGYALPLAMMALEHSPGASRQRRIALVATTCVLIGVVYGGLNTLKFGHPLSTGYMANHEGRDDVFAREARANGLVSPRWVPRNLYYTNVGLPTFHRVDTAGEEEAFLRPNTMGAGIWWTSPLLLYLLIDARRTIRDRRGVALLAGGVAVFVMLMFWHATGAVQRGYNRYSLDYIPVMFALIAPRCVEGRRRWMTAACIAWGVLYFCVVLPMPRVRMW